MRMRARNGDSKHLPRLHVGRRHESADVTVLGSAAGSVWPLRSSQAELDARFSFPSQHHASGVGTEQAGIVDEIEQGRLQELPQAQRGFYDDHGDPGEADGAFGEGVDSKVAFVGSRKRRQILEEVVFGVRQRRHLRLEVANVGRGKGKGLNVFETLVQAAENGEGSAKRILSKEEFKDAGIFVFSGLPVCVCHGDLVQIREQGRHQGIGGAAGRSKGFFHGLVSR
mmetsp:Transcript_50140/g.76247  ORF Transcript_50140/g.76247 Transcript_50140/m.76247 type:complete len:226 (+) Transcript_50140:1194-1871(+)